MNSSVEQSESGVFVSRPLPPSRAWLALIFLGASLLSVGGAIEFSTGSPMTQGQGVSSYWAVLFGFHAAAFGGASLIGAFPALAVRAIKIAWLLLVVALYAAAFAVWRSYAGMNGLGALSEWLRLAPPYLPALLPLTAGCLWRNHAILEPEPGANDGDPGPGPSSGSCRTSR